MFITKSLQVLYLAFAIVAVPQHLFAQYPEVIDLGSMAGVRGVRFYDSSVSGLGSAISSAGDVNADGHDDLLFGQYGGNRCYVVFGGNWLEDVQEFDLASLDGTRGFQIAGIHPDDQTGLAVAGGADLNGDQIDDLLLGAPNAFPGDLEGAGRAFVVYGHPQIGTSGRLDLADLDASTGCVLDGGETRARAGQDVAVAGDVNGDGHADLLVVAPYSGERETCIPVGPQLRGIALGDVDGDQDLDIVATEEGFDHYFVFLNDGTGNLADPLQAPISDPRQVRLADLDGDLDLDLVMTTIRYVERTDSLVGRISVLINVGGGSFSAPTYYKLTQKSNDVSMGFDIADFDQDGSPDLAVIDYDPADYDSQADELFLMSNDGAGSFTITGPMMTGGLPSSIVAGDFFGDGFPDLAVFERNADQIQLWRNDGAGQLSRDAAIPSILDAGGLVSADIDQDGDIDLAGTGLQVRLNRGDGTFDDVLFFPGGSEPQTGDLDGDGTIDFAGLSSAGLEIWLQRKDEGIYPQSANYPFAANKSLRLGDVDQDGLVDFVAHNGSEICIGINNGLTAIEGIERGEVYVVFGGPALGSTGRIALKELDGTNGFRIQGSSAGDRLYAAVGVGDMDGDGDSEFAVDASRLNIGGPKRDGIFIIRGSPDPVVGGNLDLRLLDGKNGFLVSGTIVDEQVTARPGGDIDLDGLSELSVANSEYDSSNPGTDTRTIVVWGSILNHVGSVITLDSILDAGALSLRSSEVDRGPWVAESPRDLNGDGWPDLPFGSPGRGPDGHSAGRVYLLYGSSTLRGTAEVLVDQLDGLNGAIANGVFEEEQTGKDLTTLHDINSDELSDLVIGIPLYGLSTDQNRGAAILLFGMKRTLSADRRFIPVTGSEAQTMQLHAGSSSQGLMYWMLGSFSGYSPGMTVPFGVLPLNFDVYMIFTILHPNVPPLEDSQGILDANGEATVHFRLPAGNWSSLVGLTLRHAYFVLDEDGFFHLFSNQVPLTLVD